MSEERAPSATSTEEDGGEDQSEEQEEPLEKKPRKRLTTNEWMAKRPHTQVLPDHIQEHLDLAKVEVEKIKNKKEETLNELRLTNRQEDYFKRKRMKLEHDYNKYKIDERVMSTGIYCIEEHEPVMRKRQAMIEKETEEMNEGSENKEEEEKIFKELDVQIKAMEEECDAIKLRRRPRKEEAQKLVKELKKLEETQDQLRSHLEKRRPVTPSDTQRTKARTTISECYKGHPVSKKLSEHVVELRDRCKELKLIADQVKSRAKQIEEKRDKLECLKERKEYEKEMDEVVESKIGQLKAHIDDVKGKLLIHYDMSRKVVESFKASSDNDNSK